MSKSKGILKIVSGSLIGFSLFWLTSHPQSSLRKRIPVTTYKNFSFLPNVKYASNTKTYHFHHWLLLSICYIPLLSSRRLRKSHLFHGVFLGSIFQGLLYKDRFTFSYPIKNLNHNFPRLLGEG